LDFHSHPGFSRVSRVRRLEVKPFETVSDWNGDHDRRAKAAARIRVAFQTHHYPAVPLLAITRATRISTWRMTEESRYAQVIELLRVESDAIAKAASRLDADNLERALSILADCKGKVILLGVGKSGIIAQKIAATMTSSGTAAVYLHPSDALHGGLGIVSSDDAVVMLSNSGETDELLELLPYLKRRAVPLLAIVGNLKSTIANRADAVIDASVDQEACPLNLAPTTSTTVALAIGDALAMTLMRAKGLTENDFASNHPAGQLGKRLTLRVADLMHSGAENPTIANDASWMDIVATITQYGLGAVNVIDRSERLEGIITDGDLRRSIQRIGSRDLEWANLKCDDLMTRNPIVTTPETLAFDALRLMEDRPSQISVLSVVDGDHKCVGLIRLHDIVRSGL
jgi:arabinose-5-phosphate isomerase